MSTPPAPSPSPPRKDAQDKSPSDEKKTLPPDAQEGPSSDEASLRAEEDEVPSKDEPSDEEEKADSEDDAQSERRDVETPPKEQKPRKRKSRRKGRRKRRKGKEKPLSEPSDKKKPDKKKPDKRKSDKKKPAKEEKPEKTKEPEKPASYDKASPEVQAYMDQLQEEDNELNNRNKYLMGAAGVALLLLLLTFWGIRRLTTGSYAVLKNIEVKQNPIDEGRLDIKYDVVKPGKVACRVNCGGVETERIDTHASAGSVEWSWSQHYQPGKNIDVTIGYRGLLSQKKFYTSFPTNSRLDVVVLMDTTRSMGPVIAELGEKSVYNFTNRMRERGLNARYALIGFGDRQQNAWDEHPFTKDGDRFHESIKGLARFNSGDVPNSALDALEKALSLKLEKKEDSVRCFYLVTAAPYHEPTLSGATAEQLAEKLAEEEVILRVFSKEEFKEDYEKLLGETGRFMPIQSFPQVFNEGRTLGD